MKPLVKILKNHKDSIIPQYAHGDDSGADLFAYLEEGIHSITIAPGERALVKTGVSFKLPEGYECQIRAKSGLALKQGITVLNGIGTIDEGYTGEIGVILINHSKIDVYIEHNQKIAQAVFTPYTQAIFETVDSLEETERGSGGYGSTGLNK